MGNIDTKTRVGFMLNVVVGILGIANIAPYGGALAAGLIAISIASIFLTGAGIFMLSRGNPTGGILGAVGSAVFVPIGLICMIGCLQCREKIRNADVMTAGAPLPEEPAASAEETYAAPERPSAPGDEPAPANTSDKMSECPLACYDFADVRLLGWFFVVAGVGLLLFILSQRDHTPLFAVVSFCVTGIMLIVQGEQRRNRQVFSLYRKHLECVTGTMNCEPVSIPYDCIREAKSGGSRFHLYIAAADDTRKISIPLGLIKGSERGEAREVLEGKMRELGVLREN